MTQEEFIEYHSLRSGIYYIQNRLSDIHFRAKKVVIEYIKNKRPHDYRADVQINIDFNLGANAISVYYEYTPRCFGSIDDEKPRTVMFNLTYEEVFGWNMEDWTKPLSLPRVNQLLVDTLKAELDRYTACSPI